jgi:hypothetical protein
MHVCYPETDIAVVHRPFDEASHEGLRHRDDPEAEHEEDKDKAGDQEPLHFGVINPIVMVTLRRVGLSKDVLTVVFFTERIIGAFSTL